MAREIKFRAWSKVEEEIVYGIDLTTQDGTAHPINGNWDNIMSLDERVELMQYTGLKDKNNVEIYEGDFLEDSLYVAWCDKQGGFQAFLPDNYCMACNGDMHWYEVVEDSKNYEVIGNIYQNPELLKNNGGEE